MIYHLKVFFMCLFSGLVLLGCEEKTNDPENHAPEIQSITASPSTIEAGSLTDLACVATDPEQDPLTYTWSATYGSFPNGSTGSTVQWQAPSTSGNYAIEVAVSDGAETDQDFVTVIVEGAGPPLTEQDFPLGNSGVYITMVYINPGSFMQGAIADEVGAQSCEYPRHQVTIDYGYWMSKYEVTQAQWEAITGYNNSTHIGDNKPVDSVSWDEIQENFLSELNNQTTGNPWRFPSESEWEYAYRAGTATRYYWGEDDDYSEIDTYAWYLDISGDEHHEVGLKQPNAWGLYDMAGNVYEWVEDYYHDDYIGAPDDGSSWLSPSGTERVLRGGSFDHPPVGLRAAGLRFYLPSDNHINDRDQGFRLVRDDD